MRADNSLSLVRSLETPVEVESLLPHLLEFSEEHRVAARALQKEVDAFGTEMRDAVDKLWPPKTARYDDSGNLLPSSSSATSSWAERMEEKKRMKQDAIERIERPEIAAAAWRIDVDILADPNRVNI